MTDGDFSRFHELDDFDAWPRPAPAIPIPFAAEVFEAARERVAEHAYHTPLLTSRLLSEHTGFTVRLKAEVFQRTGSYKIRGPLNKFPQLSADERARGVICSSAGNHAQGWRSRRRSTACGA